jgi:hypothetical protein
MSKRDFRASSSQRAEYPTLGEFDRRGFLARLGAAALAAAGLGVLSACGERAVDDVPDEGPGPQGVARQPDAGQDQHPMQDRPPLDGGPPMKDSAGVGPMPDALVDPPVEGGAKKKD